MTATPMRPAEPATGGGMRLVRSPWLWGPVGIAVLFAASTAASQLAGLVGGGWGGVVFAAGIVTVLALYVVVMRVLAGRRPVELTGAGGGRRLLTGLALGAGIVAASAGIVALLGGYDIRWSGQDAVRIVVMALLLGAGAGVLEESMFRGVGLAALERVAGSWVALVVTSALFGAIHLNNDGATVWSVTAIAVGPGFMLGAAFLWTRDLRFVIGVHAAWNVTEGLLGISVSGGAQDGLWSTTAQGPLLLTGGDFGLEASLVPVLLCLGTATLMLVAAHRRGNLRRASRRPELATQEALTH